MSQKISDGIYSVGSNRAVIAINKVKGEPTASAPKLLKSNGDSDVCAWGENNLWPVEFERKLKK